jgi:ABC-type proline/glycine betaine transport system permease subunit
MSIQQKREPLDFNEFNDKKVSSSLATDFHSVQPTIRITNLSLQDEDGVILEFKSYSN